MKSILICLSLFLSLNINAQNCTSTSHSVNINDSWKSCNEKLSPNPIRGNSHWVMYDLGYAYKLSTTRFWNYNVEGETEQGMKNIVIDFSLNGDDWTEIVNFQLSEASGTNSYEGEEGPNLGSTNTRYVLITAIDTWGGDCPGLSEVKFDLDNIVPVNNIEYAGNAISLFPNPATQSITIKTNFDLKEIIIVNATGQEINRMPYQPQFDITHLADGIYFLKTTSPSNEILIKRFIKQSP